MLKEKHSWYSDNLSKDVELVVYGHFGISLLFFPTFGDSNIENEELGFIKAIAPLISKGKIKVFSVPAVNKESWHNSEIPVQKRSQRHFEYNEFLAVEVLPFIYDQCGGAVPVITVGASLGAFHAANTFFRRPDIFIGTIALSPFFNIRKLSGEYFDENCYFNSPFDYLPNLHDEYWLSYLRNKHHLYFYSGRGRNEHPEEIKNISNILLSKSIPHHTDIWSEEYEHNPDSWQLMLKHILTTKL